MKKIAPYNAKKRYPLRALKLLSEWVQNPASEEGAKRTHRMLFCLTGPDMHRLAKKMRRNPETREILDKKQELGLLLADKDRMDRLPANTVGAAYNQLMTGPDMVPSYYLAAFCYKDGHFDALEDWSDDAKFLISRHGNTHDLTHVLTGYGTDLSGEAILATYAVTDAIGFPKFIAYPLAFLWSIFGFAIGQQPIGFWKWTQLHFEAVDRATHMRKKNKFAEIPYENILDMPLTEAREKLGIKPFRYQEHVNEDGFLKSKNWLKPGCIAERKYLAAKKDKKYLETEFLKIVAACTLVENGFNLREVMSASHETIARGYEAFNSGADKAAIRYILTAR
jgi:ubiquinone biosynthesis protein Coq4